MQQENSASINRMHYRTFFGFLLLALVIIFFFAEKSHAEWCSPWDIPLGMENCINKQPPPPPFVKSVKNEDQHLYENRRGQIRMVDAADDPLDSEYTDFSDSAQAYAPVPDPLEPWNRFWFQFNDVLYHILWKPIIVTWKTIAPEPVRTSIENFFHNLAFPIRFVSLIFQGRLEAAGVEFSKFVMNSTFGIGGLFDPASHLEARVEVEDTDLGQTFASWGIGPGMYLVWPLLGPTSLRDTVGLVGEAFLEPTSYYLYWYESAGMWAGSRTNKMTFIYDTYDAMYDAAVDPYIAFRDAYFQYREANRPR